MSKARNLSEVDLRPYYLNKPKPRNSIDQKRGVLQPKINRDSPYSHIPTITRSISTLKKSPSKNRSNSPKLSKHGSNNISMLNLNVYEAATNSQRSISESYRQLHKDIPPKINFAYKSSHENKQNPILTEISQLEDRLKAASKINLLEGIKEYNNVFEYIIDKDSVYGHLLRKIKNALDEWSRIREKSIHNSEALKKKLAEANQKIQVMAEDRKFLDRRIQQISQENLDLCKSIEESEASYTDIEERLLKITNFKLDNLERDENTWKALVLENISYNEICKKMREDIKNYRKKEKKLLSLIVAMKNRGYPVEEVYNHDVDKINKSIEENSESDRIVSGRAPEVAKPSNIPPLRMDKIDIESFSSSISNSTSSIHQTP